MYLKKIKNRLTTLHFIEYFLGFVSIRRFQIEASRSVLKSISDRGFVSIYHVLFQHDLCIG